MSVQEPSDGIELELAGETKVLLLDFNQQPEGFPSRPLPLGTQQTPCQWRNR